MTGTTTDDASPVLVRGLVKRFGRFTAPDGLDLEVAAGQVHGFLGPNGAGESTTIRTLLQKVALVAALAAPPGCSSSMSRPAGRTRSWSASSPRRSPAREARGAPCCCRVTSSPKCNACVRR